MWLTVLELQKHSFTLTTPPFEESENIYLMTSLTSLEPLMVPQCSEALKLSDTVATSCVRLFKFIF